MRRLTLPTDSAVRKDIPLRSGCYEYFPAALMRVAMISKIGNDKHNPGEPLHHARGKSMDHGDCIERHLSDIADYLAHRVVWTQEEQDAILTEAGYLCWRALALSQELHEKFGAPLAPAARLPENPVPVPAPPSERAHRAIADAMGWDQKQQGDHLGRKIREYGPQQRVHQPWCGLDKDHSGLCHPVIGAGGQAPSATPPDSPQPVLKGYQSFREFDGHQTSTPGTVQASADGKHCGPAARGPL